MNKHIETEARFLEIDVDALKQRLAELQAKDEGEDLLTEVIFYDAAGVWQRNKDKVVRIRATKDACILAFKHNFADHAQGTTEIQTEVSDFAQTRAFLTAIGLVEFRQQEKRRHSFQLGGVTVDIDQWPQIPAYVELEGDSEEALQAVAAQLGLDWSTADTHNAAWVIENVYHIPVRELHTFTFDKVE